MVTRSSRKYSRKVKSMVSGNKKMVKESKKDGEGR